MSVNGASVFQEYLCLFSVLLTVVKLGMQKIWFDV